jgi:hypothetical protein
VCHPETPEVYDVIALCDSAALADELLGLILSGRIATSVEACPLFVDKLMACRVSKD